MLQLCIKPSGFLLILFDNMFWTQYVICLQKLLKYDNSVIFTVIIWQYLATVAFPDNFKQFFILIFYLLLKSTYPFNLSE